MVCPIHFINQSIVWKSMRCVGLKSARIQNNYAAGKLSVNVYLRIGPFINFNNYLICFYLMQVLRKHRDTKVFKKMISELDIENKEKIGRYLNRQENKITIPINYNNNNDYEVTWEEISLED